jgi:hypothetical protein
VRADVSAPIVGPVDDPGMMAGAQVAFQRQANAADRVHHFFATH